MSVMRSLLHRPTRRRPLFVGSPEDMAVALARARVSGRQGLAIMRDALAEQERARLVTYDAARCCWGAFAGGAERRELRVTGDTLTETTHATLAEFDAAANELRQVAWRLPWQSLQQREKVQERLEQLLALVAGELTVIP
jgi:hypothetical protein